MFWNSHLLFPFRNSSLLKILFHYALVMRMGMGATGRDNTGGTNASLKKFLFKIFFKAYEPMSLWHKNGSPTR